MRKSLSLLVVAAILSSGLMIASADAQSQMGPQPVIRQVFIQKANSKQVWLMTEAIKAKSVTISYKGSPRVATHRTGSYWGIKVGKTSPSCYSFTVVATNKHGSVQNSPRQLCSS